MKLACEGVLDLLVAPLSREVVCSAAQAVLGWPRVWTRGHHELSKRTGTGPWQGHKIRMEIRMPTPHWGHSFGWLARRTA